MARRPAPPSASPGASARPSGAGAGKRSATAPKARATAAGAQRAAARPAAPRGGGAQRVDVREWASGIRLSAFSVIMLSLVILGAWVLTLPAAGGVAYLSMWLWLKIAG